MASGDAVRLSKMLFDARESIEMWADHVETVSGTLDVHNRTLVAQIDAYRTEQGWNPNGFGGESDG